MSENSTNLIDRAVIYHGKVPREPRWTAPKTFDVFEFGEPPVISNWQLVHLWTDRFKVFVGNITGHPLLGDCLDARTSPVIWISTRLGFARTRSRYYRLGAKAAKRGSPADPVYFPELDPLPGNRFRRLGR